MKSTIVLLLFLATLCSSNALIAGTADAGDADLEALLNQTVSAAAKYEQTIGDAPASVTVVTADDIEKYGYQNMEDVLRTVRGFYVGNDRNYTTLGVRGFGRPGDYSNRILLLLDGHTINDNVYNAAPAGKEISGVDLAMIERIEIVRGPGSALYGTSAMLAVVNLVTKDAKSSSPYHLGAQMGSYGQMVGSGAISKVFGDGAELMISARVADMQGPDLYFPEYDDPSTNNGVAEGLDWEEYFGVVTTLHFKDFRLGGAWTSRDKGIPTGAWGVDFNDDRAHTLDEHGFLELKYETSIGASHNVMARTHVNRYFYEGGYPYDDYDSWDSNTGQWAGIELQHRWDVRSNNRLTVGGEYQDHSRADYKLWDPDAVYFDRSSSFTVTSLYAQNEFQPTRYLGFVAGIRHDDYSSSTAATTPRAAMIVSPSADTAIKLLYGEAFRTPSFYERYYEDDSTPFKPNPDLTHESIKTIEATLEQQMGRHWFGAVSVYQNKITNLIDQTIDPADSVITNGNVGSATGQGVEFELRGRVERFSGYGNYAYQDSKDDDTGQTLTNTPEHRVSVGMIVPVMQQLYAAVESQYETGRKTIYGSTTDNNILVNLKLTANLNTVGAKTSASLQIRNLFDEDYAIPGGFEHEQAMITQDGRRLLFTVSTHF